MRRLALSGRDVFRRRDRHFLPEVHDVFECNCFELVAREFLIDALAAERATLLRHVKEQGRKITDLEREVQKQATLRDQAEQQLADARKEIAALRGQLPDDATINAYHALVEHLTSTGSSQIASELRIAA